MVRDTDSNKRRTYEIPHGLLEWHSSYFAAALDPDSEFSKKKQEDHLDLEEDFDVFEAF